MRDKRGYEHTYVMHAYRPNQGLPRARVLYLFRSPPNIQVGRQRLDAEVREALEHTHPDLTFDWVGLMREPMPPMRSGPRDRDAPRRSSGRKQRSGPQAGSAPQPEVIDDESPLGQALGGAEAARMRTRYSELVLRIGRRARTPEDRDRLLESAHGLNPDAWVGQDVIRAQAVEFDARCDAIAGELPRRRRGRRGGKARDEAAGAEEAPQAAAEEAPDQETPGSVIIGRQNNAEEPEDASEPESQTPVSPGEPLALGDDDGTSPADGGDPERPADADGADTGPAPDIHEPG